MSIVSRSILSVSPHSGGYRARFLYELSDGRKIERGPIPVASEAETNNLLISIEPSVLEAVQSQDADEAVSLNIKTAFKEASLEQVQYSWLKIGFDEDEHYKAYEKIKDIGTSLLSLGLTDEEYAVMLNVTVEDATATREYWEFLDANKAAIEAYALIAGVKL